MAEAVGPMMFAGDNDIRVYECTRDAPVEHMRGIKSAIGGICGDEHMAVVDVRAFVAQIVSEGKPYFLGHGQYLRDARLALDK